MHCINRTGKFFLWIIRWVQHSIAAGFKAPSISEALLALSLCFINTFINGAMVVIPYICI